MARRQWPSEYEQNVDPSSSEARGLSINWLMFLILHLSTGVRYERPCNDSRRCVPRLDYTTNAPHQPSRSHRLCEPRRDQSETMEAYLATMSATEMDDWDPTCVQNHCLTLCISGAPPAIHDMKQKQKRNRRVHAMRFVMPEHPNTPSTSQATHRAG